MRFLRTYKGISLPLKGADAGGESTLSISGAPLDYPCESCSMCENESIEKEIAKADWWEKFQIRALCFLACVVILLINGCRTAHAEVPETQAVLAIIGEAENQGYEGMLAVACAIRNRGTLKGVYGLKAPRVVQKKYSPKTYAKALTAWRKSVDCDVTKGADHWENVKAFGKPKWAKTMKLTYVCKDHEFYRSN